MLLWVYELSQHSRIPKTEVKSNKTNDSDSSVVCLTTTNRFLVVTLLVKDSGRMCGCVTIYQGGKKKEFLTILSVIS